MTRVQKARLRLSEIRERLNALLGIEKRSADESAEVDRLTTEYPQVEQSYRAALITEEGERREVEASGAVAPDAETVERNALLERAEVRSYIQAAVAGRPVEGAERELQSAFSLDGGHEFPLDLLSPVEMRVDADAGTPTTGTPQMHRFFPSVFAQGALAFLGVGSESVGTGEASYSVMDDDAGQEPELVAAGSAAPDTEAFSWTTASVKPRRLSVRFRYRREAVATWGQVYEQSIRRQAMESMSDRLDYLVLNGDGTAPNWGGLLDDDGLAAPTAATAKLTYTAGQAIPYDRVDGRYAVDTGSLRMLVGTATYSLAGTLYRTSAGAFDDSLLDEWMRRTGGVRVSAHIPIPAANKQQALIVAGGAPAPWASLYTWPSVSVIVDEVSRAKEGEIVVTLLSFYDFAVIRAAAARRLEIQTA